MMNAKFDYLNNTFQHSYKKKYLPPNRIGKSHYKIWSKKLHLKNLWYSSRKIS